MLPLLVMQAMAFAGGLLDSLSAVNRTDLAALAPPDGGGARASDAAALAPGCHDAG
ncbi:hypothetical protein [Azospirillum brasilense]|uniref:hypothetical protein n=1 Tax=Azospirillum brasilense TaxID=192 RepID=UPI001FFEEF7B|nr:hypothetical protein [Azospirillum brasilense]